MLAEFM